MVFPHVDGPPVLVVNASEDASQQIGVVLVEGGYQPIRAPDGVTAIRLAGSQKPRAAVVDVAVTDVVVVDLIDRLRELTGLSELKVLLLASVFNKTAYKRRPTRLYGADDYIELHHIPDMLGGKLSKLLGLPEVVGIAELLQRRRQILSDVDKRMELGGAERIDAMAHAVVSDIALYHQDEFERAVRGELASELEQSLAEGRRLLADFADPEELAGRDAVLEAFENYIERMRKAGETS
jgi:response regulator RpfG family c-di-GMP phosphodiesterase